MADALLWGKWVFFLSFLWGWYCVLLTCGMQLFCPWSVPVSHLHYISLKGSSSHYDSECRWRERLKEERNRGEKEQKVGRFVFHTAHMGGSAPLTNAWVKKFQELKCSMPQSHDIHLTPSSHISISPFLPPLSALPSSPLGQPGVITISALEKLL